MPSWPSHWRSSPDSLPKFGCMAAMGPMAQMPARQ
jgi:hypothetical protein